MMKVTCRVYARMLPSSFSPTTEIPFVTPDGSARYSTPVARDQRNARVLPLPLAVETVEAEYAPAPQLGKMSGLEVHSVRKHGRTEWT